MKVKKRNGEIVDFKRNKVFSAITRASESMNIKDKNLIRSITDKVITKLGDREEVNVEYIQDIVEETLMEEKQFLIARAYILWRQSRNASRQVASSMGVVNDLKLPVSSLTVLAKRYLLRNIDGDIIETPKELYKRVSTAIAKIEEKQGTTSKEIKTLTKEFYDFMASGTFLPNSPCLFSAGTEMSQLSACFTLNIDDSLESIFDVLKKSAKIFQTGGGVGYNFSNIRPKDDVVRSTKGVSSGPLSFMKVYNEMCEIIKQGSFRRGAMMGILDVNHPNILDFIIMKGKEGYLSNFNISVAVTDNFMKAVKTNKDIQLVNPRTGKPIQSIPASAIWDLLVTEAWKTGDPGLVFIDTVNKSESNVVPKLGPIKSCNPCGEIFMYPSESCLASDTLIVTPDGITPIKTRVGNTEGYIYNNGFSKYNKIVSRGEKPIVKVVLSNGLSIKCTKDHKFRLKNGKDVEAQHLTSEDVMELNKEYPYNFIDDTDKKYEMYGWMHGDGWYNNSIGISFNYKDGDKPVKEYLLPLFQHEFGCEGIKPSREDEVSYQIQTTQNRSLEHAHNLGFVKGLAIDKQLPTTFYDWNDIQQRSFIRGLFSADAGISGRTNSQIIFTSNSETLVEQVQQYLQCLGIKGHKRQTIFNSKLNRNPQYKLQVTCDSARAYMKYIGFVEGSSKTDKFVASLHHDREVTFKELIDEGKTETVYDVVEVSNGNIFIANGIQVHNCNLGSINLTKFVKEKENCLGLEMDFDKLGQAVKLAIRFLDNVIDANKYPTKEIQDMSLRLRRIGLGVMGWADTLILLKIPYDSQEALDLAGKVMGFITKTATKTSVELGERRGSFPEFEDSIWAKRGYKHMRNSAVTCIAPTGSISILAGCSQSIEPLMSVVTVRNLEETLGSKLVDVNPLFQQEAIKRGFWSEELMNKVSRTLSIQNMQEIPEDVRRIFVTAMDVKPEWHVRMQAAFQANTHNACSKTINLPHNATPHDVEEAFMLAWKLGAKGITVFRDGCLRKQVFTCVECEVPT